MDEIQDVIPLLFMNGLSTRKAKKSISKLLGNKGLSHQNVLSDEFNAWKKRDLSGTEAVYLILDGIRFGVMAGTREKEAVLAAWAFLSDGSRELVGVSFGNQESCNVWKIFYASTYEHAKEVVEIFKKNWGSKYKSALECLSEDIEYVLLTTSILTCTGRG